MQAPSGTARPASLVPILAVIMTAPMAQQRGMDWTAFIASPSRQNRSGIF